MDYEKMWYMLKRELLKEDKYCSKYEVLIEMDQIEIAEQIMKEDNE